MSALESIIRTFRRASADPTAYAQAWKAKTHRPVIGYLCTYTPVELIQAAGALPLRLFESTGDMTAADLHFQSYSCSLARGCLEGALQGEFDFLDGMVFSHTCDTMQRLSDIWRMNIAVGFHTDLLLPSKLHTESAVEYMLAVTNTLQATLQDRLGAVITEPDLRAAVGTYNRIRQTLRRLYEMRRHRPEIMKSGDLHALLKCAMIMDPVAYLEKITRLSALLDKEKMETTPGRKRVVLCGGACSQPDLYTIVEDAGAVVVYDDLCTGGRFLTGEIALEGDLAASIVRRYAARPVCPAKHAGLFSRAAELLQSVTHGNADGVIIFYLKFCDPHAFDYPYLKAALEEKGIPVLAVELETAAGSRGQLRTRCEAFVEML